MLGFLWMEARSGAAGAPSWVVVRCLLAASTAVGLTLVLGRVLIPFLVARGIVERVDKTDSIELARRHRGKFGTPTMGGFVFLPALGVSTLLFARWDVPLVFLCLGVVVAFAGIGFRDDRIKLRSPDRSGLGKRCKLRCQIGVSLAAAVVLRLLIDRGRGEAMTVCVPFVRDAGIGLGFLCGVPFVLFAAFILTASTNAVNLADGLDGLAAGCSTLAFIALAALGYLSGSAELAPYLSTPFVSGAEEVAVFASAAAGACVGFLWFNFYPARAFMGDTGSLALGGALGMTALAIRQEILLALVGGIFVVEVVSVILQIVAVRWFHRRIFRCAPLHHHFQFAGWPEWTVTGGFWLAGAILAVVSVATMTLL